MHLKGAELSWAAFNGREAVVKLQCLGALVELAVPLFIFAATACRYIADLRDNPARRLEIVLQYQSASHVSQLDRTYLPILSRLFDDEDEADRQRRISEFRDIVGS